MEEGNTAVAVAEVVPLEKQHPPHHAPLALPPASQKEFSEDDRPEEALELAEAVAEVEKPVYGGGGKTEGKFAQLRQSTPSEVPVRGGEARGTSLQVEDPAQLPALPASEKASKYFPPLQESLNKGGVSTSSTRPQKTKRLAPTTRSPVKERSAAERSAESFKAARKSKMTPLYT